MKIKPGAGFWNVTRYPYGGCFGRADIKSQGLRVALKERNVNGGNGAESRVMLLESFARSHKIGDDLIVRNELLEDEEPNR